MKYDCDVLTIGMGPAGMAVSAMASEMGLRVCAVESHKIGGECMNVGCIPSKALLRIAQIRSLCTRLKEMDLEEVPLPAVRDPFGNIQRDLQYISEKKTMKMFRKVDLRLGQGKAVFVDPHTIRLGEHTISARRIFVAVGTRPELPEFPGLAEVDPLTNENLFALERPPASMAIIGAGAIACEMAQAFARLGTRCTVIYRGPRILRREDPEAAVLLEQAFAKEGIEILHETTPTNFAKRDGQIHIETSSGQTVVVERVLAALGRKMDLAPLKLESAGVEYTEKGIRVNKYLQTTRKHIYAVGDCNGYFQFSHAAMHQGMTALINCMLPGFFKRDFGKFVVPHTIFTEPQISQVGLTAAELDARGSRYRTVKVDYADYGAAIAEKIPVGFVKALVSPTGKIYGASVVGEGSADMINEWALAIQKGLRMHSILFLQHSFPSMGFLNKRVAETWMMGVMQSSSLLRKLSRCLFRCC